MERKPFFVGCLSGFFVGVLISLTFGHAFQAWNSARSDSRGTAAEWKSYSIQERTIFVEGFTHGYVAGSVDVCSNADRLFETHGPIYLKNGTLNEPIAICLAALDHFTRMTERGKVQTNYSVYSDVITDFYKRYPKYNNVPFYFLMRQLTDNRFETADQLSVKFERHELQSTF